MIDDALDVLMYLFEHYVGEEDHYVVEREVLHVELHEAGFPAGEIDRAFDWLECLQGNDFAQTYIAKPGTGIRIYAEEEQQMLNAAGQGYLLFLEQKGILDAATREVVIDYVMALGCEELDLERLQWLVLMVMSNQPECAEAYDYMQEIVINVPNDQLQ